MSLKLLGVAGTLVASTLAQVTTGPSMKNLKRMDHSGSYTYNISECVGKSSPFSYFYYLDNARIRYRMGKIRADVD